MEYSLQPQYITRDGWIWLRLDIPTFPDKGFFFNRRFKYEMGRFFTDGEDVYYGVDDESGQSYYTQRIFNLN